MTPKEKAKNYSDKKSAEDFTVIRKDTAEDHRADKEMSKADAVGHQKIQKVLDKQVEVGEALIEAAEYFSKRLNDNK